MPKPLLKIQDLEKTYSNGVQALKGISFDVKAGEFLVVIGLSGSGKSTLLRCLNRLTEPTGGSVFFNQIDTTKLKTTTEVRLLRTKMGMIFQNFSLISRYSVLKNVLIGKSATTSTFRSFFSFFSEADKTEALKYLKLVGISEKAYMRADQLSGGQQQRVAIARALAQNPEIILADEPVASLDPATCRIVMDYLKKVNQELGITVICNLHFLNLVRQYATRVIALKDGKLVYEGAPQDIDEAWFEKIYGVSGSL